MTKEQVYQRTLKQSEAIREAGYTLVEGWMHEKPNPWWDDRLQKNKTRHFRIQLYFELYLDGSKRKQVTADLIYENEPMQISVSVADNVEQKANAQDVERCCSRRAKSCVLQKACGGANENPLAPVQKRKNL